MPGSYKRIFIVNSLTGWVGKVFQIIFIIILTPLLLGGLGKERYGAWILTGQFSAYLAMLDLGVSSSIARYYVRHMAEKDFLGNQRLYSTAVFILCIVAFAVIVISWFARDYLAHFYMVGESIWRDFTAAVLLSGFCLAVTLPLRVFVGILQAHHKLYHVDTSIFVSSLVKFAGVLCLLHFWHLSLTNLAFILLVSELAKYSLVFILARRLSGGATKFSLDHVSWEMTRKIYSLGIASFIWSLLTTVRQQVPVTIVGRVFGLAAVPVISIPLALLRNIGALLGRIGTIFTALSSELDALGKKDRIESLSVEITRLLLSVTFAGALLIIFFSHPILTLWLKDSVDTESLSLISGSLSVMVVPYFVFVCLTGVRNTLMATGYHFRVVLSTGMITAACFCLFFVLTGNVTQVAYVIGTTFLAISLYFVHEFSRYLGKTFLSVFADMFSRPSFFAFLLALSFWPVRKYVRSELFGILIFCVMAVLYLVLTLERKYRRLALKTIGLARYAQDITEAP